MSRILDLLAIAPSARASDYVERKHQFHLHGLLTEQRHERTRHLSALAQRDSAAALEVILTVDDDVVRTLARLARDPAPLERAADAIVDAVRAGHRVYVYGCGATGRLAKQMESSLWRPFWRRARALVPNPALAAAVPAAVEDALVGEMTGADRALVSSLEGFEDVPELGALQLQDHGVRRGDVVICVTEGGETSSVIGTIMAARAQYGPSSDDADAARERLYFVYNNPDEVLRPFARSVQVLDEPGITKLCLATGPQALSGSTRMQATTIATFVVGVVLEEAICRLLQPHLSAAHMHALGFPNLGDGGDGANIGARLDTLAGVLAAVRRSVPALARLTDAEAATYAGGGRATYYAEQGIISVFIDCAERSPTFGLAAFDEIDAPEPRAWVQAWTDAAGPEHAWERILGRPFRGLTPALYQPRLGADIADPWLRRAALASLDRAGDDQAGRYDFSFTPANVARGGPSHGDLGVLVALGDEHRELAQPGAGFYRFQSMCDQRGVERFVVRVGHAPSPPTDAEHSVDVVLDEGPDPLLLRHHIAAKVLLNAHSTAVMARLGRVVSNTMTNVRPSNLKLIGRATFLIMSHANDCLAQPVRPGQATETIDFGEANAVLFDVMEWLAREGRANLSEVELAIVRVVASARAGRALTWDEACALLERDGLAGFLARHAPSPPKDSADGGDERRDD
ncbi:hypothetical protein [Haliangium sp.]|uniref:hypothetical protein n=1 Tax=Haliangium sp. TaxID=2663208 RepID=UPI003D1315D8